MPEFRMPSLGADMESGTVLEWLVRPGDQVHRGDVVAVVDTDKAAIEVECFDDGVVEALLVEPGRRVPVGTALARLGEAGAAAPAPAPAPVSAPAPPAGPAPAAAPVRAAQVAAPHVVSPLVRHLARERGIGPAELSRLTDGRAVVRRADLDRADLDRAGRPAPRRVRASPLARRLAAQAGVDLAEVRGSGSGDAVTAADVRHALAQPPVTERAAVPAQAPLAQPPGDDRQSTMRSAIAALMSRSNREIPHYYLTATIDVGTALEHLAARNRELPVEQRVIASALLLGAAARAADDVGTLNGTWTDDGFRAASTVDLGLVVSLRAGGIVVPVIPGADRLGAGQIMTAMRDLVARARRGRLRASELGPPTITVTNLGEQGVDSVLGVIYPPQVALVGFGAVAERPWAVNGLLGVRPLVVASLSADHRASDGAIGARYLKRVDELLQAPEELWHPNRPAS